jgi:hypothetical protein
MPSFLQGFGDDVTSLAVMYPAFRCGPVTADLDGIRGSRPFKVTGLRAREGRRVPRSDRFSSGKASSVSSLNLAPGQ